MLFHLLSIADDVILPMHILHFQSKFVDEYLCVCLCGAFTVAASAFYKVQPVIEFMKEVFERERGFNLERTLQDFLRRKFAKEMKG